MQPTMPIEEGSPVTKNWTNSKMSGTADEQSASGNIKTADTAGTAIHTNPVPLFLVPQTISAEIHAHGGDISMITIRRTRRHVYAITLTKSPTKSPTKPQTKPEPQRLAPKNTGGDAHAD